MSFGTGYHESTRLVLRFLPGLVAPDARVLDAGKGTGILTIAALKLGAASAFAFDIDPWIEQNIRENIARNGFDACERGRVSLDVRGLDRAVELRFVDEGHGMDERAAKRASEPFFTTKNTSDRMGLGLFLARTLIDSLGGRLTSEAATVQGTTSSVVLPQGP